LIAQRVVAEDATLRLRSWTWATSWRCSSWCASSKTSPAPCSTTRWPAPPSLPTCGGCAPPS